MVEREAFVKLTRNDPSLYMYACTHVCMHAYMYGGIIVVRVNCPGKLSGGMSIPCGLQSLSVCLLQPSAIQLVTVHSFEIFDVLVHLNCVHCGICPIPLQQWSTTNITLCIDALIFFSILTGKYDKSE